MATDRAMKAALAVLEQTECEHMDRERSLVACDDCTASLIDAAVGLPELEARIEELERECDMFKSMADDWMHAAEGIKQHKLVVRARDAALARVAELERELSNLKRFIDLCDVEQFDLANRAFRSRDKALKRESKLMAERDAALRKLEAVCGLHKQGVIALYSGGEKPSGVCIHCRSKWPCATQRLARGEK